MKNRDTPIPRQKFYTAIKDIYSDGSKLSARECSEKLRIKGIVKFGIRQESQPRINEMCKLGWLESVGSKFDETTKKTVTVYQLVK